MVCLYTNCIFGHNVIKQLMIESKYFVTYEDLIEHLEEKTGFAPPRIIEGKQRFLGKFNKWFMNFEDASVDTVRWRCIFPDPKLNISYPYPIDEVAVVCSLTNAASAVTDAHRILREYQLDVSLSKRQSMTLSGGELLLLSFAKAKGLKDITETIYICTPTQWLHHSKYFLLNNLIGEFADSGKDVYLLLLEGEQLEMAPDIENTNISMPPYGDLERLPWTLQIKNVSKTFDAQSFPKENSEKTIKFAPADFDKELQSPTLITGDNGVGKSVLVKMLSNIYQPTIGRLAIRCLGNEGFARVLMQDSLDQLFGETIDDHFSRVFKFDKERGKLAKELYEKMLNELRVAVKSIPNLRKIKLAASNADFVETVLQVKFALVCERLASKPPLLILDEPDWCLSRPVTELFISIVVAAAHQSHVPVLIITHLGHWYEGLYNSVINLKNHENSNEVLIEEHVVNEHRI